MLSSFTIKNFKSYREATLQLAPLTVLIGANASGKSNAIEALRLLSWIAEGKRLGAIRHDLLEEERAIRGNVCDLAYRGALDSPPSDPEHAPLVESGQAAGHLLSLGYGGVRAFSFSCRTTDAHWHDYSITLEAREGDELHISDERLGGGGLRSFAPLFEVVTPSKGALGDMYVAYNNFARGGRKPQIVCSDQTAVLCGTCSTFPVSTRIATLFCIGSANWSTPEPTSCSRWAPSWKPATTSPTPATANGGDAMRPCSRTKCEKP